MIPYETILPFASIDEARWVLTLPRVIDDLIVATDGRVLIEVPVAEVAMPAEPIEIREGNFPNYLEILSPDYIGPMAEPMAAPVIVGERPPKTICCLCDGKKIFGMSTCEECDGEGTIEDLRKWIAEYEHGKLAAHLVERVQSLPAVHWFQPRGPGHCVPFRFGKRGRGAVMPLRAR